MSQSLFEESYRHSFVKVKLRIRNILVHISCFTNIHEQYENVHILTHKNGYERDVK